MESPLMPQKGGYPIILGQGIEAEDLEVEYIPFKDGDKDRLIAVRNPYLMKGATKAIRALNNGRETELEEIAEQIADRKTTDVERIGEDI
jgi:hypothetical protein